ncbi:angiopoietin-1-like [Periophthalmus magnuspinnatus]|uniref:angiopoietin-1-like n=1 Tax=Periophthalmus magnuspinnatus TaxID=409849 RepID=UPI00145B7BFA|nr:angiopoietin-1-like [Periophthalmus magnuspinnatus]
MAAMLLMWPLSDGGWTVFQRRSGPQVKFNRGWLAYKNGFGSLTQDHWLGLRKVFALTKAKTRNWILRVDLWDHEGNTAFAEYSHFKLGNEKSGFKLHVKTYKGTAGDAIRGVYAGIDQNGFGFSTIDRDNDGCHPCIFGDITEEECVASEGGGWWFSRCGSASLHGDYHPMGEHIGWASGLHWDSWKGRAPYSLKATRMMVKPMV